MTSGLGNPKIGPIKPLNFKPINRKSQLYQEVLNHGRSEPSARNLSLQSGRRQGLQATEKRLRDEERERDDADREKEDQEVENQINDRIGLIRAIGYRALRCSELECYSFCS